MTPEEAEDALMAAAYALPLEEKSSVDAFHEIGRRSVAFQEAIRAAYRQGVAVELEAIANTPRPGQDAMKRIAELQEAL